MRQVNLLTIKDCFKCTQGWTTVL